MKTWPAQQALLEMLKRVFGHERATHEWRETKTQNPKPETQNAKTP